MSDGCGCDCEECRSTTADSDESDHCEQCWGIATDVRRLGILIRAFVRRAEVEALASIVAGYSDHAQICDWRHLYGACSCGYVAHAQPALDRLAALARGDAS